MFKVNDYVFIIPTGDPMIDAFLDQQMTITDIIRTPYETVVSPSSGAHYTSWFNRYELTNAAGESITVIDGEMEKGERLNGS